MTAAALAVVAGSLPDDQSHFDGVAQADQAVAQLGLAIEGLDLVLQVAQLADGAREPVTGADQAHVVPHDILDGLHIPLDEGRVGFLGQVGFVPGGDVVAGRDGRRSGCGEASLDIAGGARPPDQSLQQEVEARRFAPCSPVQETSPTAYRLAMLERPHSSTATPPQK